LAAMGPSGQRQASELSTRHAHYAAAVLSSVPGLSLAFAGPFFNHILFAKLQGVVLPCAGLIVDFLAEFHQPFP
jgi:hypothetical protein